jgi:hypothetical protein
MDISAERPRTDGLLARLKQREAWLFVLVMAIVPNLIFVVAMPYFVAFRPIAPPLYLAAGMLSLRLRPMVAYALFGLVAAIDLSLVVAVAFHLPITIAFQSMRYLASIDIAASSFYLAVMGMFFLNAMGAAWLVNRYRSSLRAASPLPAALLAVSLPLLDFQINGPYLKQPAAHFESAMALNGLDSETIAANGRNLLIVLVEGLGAFSDPATRLVLSDRLTNAAVAERYSIGSGISNFQGSTTSAESRELCGRWGDHTDYLRADSFDCLPRQLAEKGFETVSYHGYSSSMFDRNVWYPKIGITEPLFLEDMVSRGQLFPSRCGSVFKGLCDKDVGDEVHRRLLRNPTQPKMVYWLTLNSHIPYVPKDNSQLRCGDEHAIIQNRRVCELTEIWGDVFDTVSAIARDPDLPPTDILIVGDHTTPLWEKSAASAFTPGKVDWYFLRDRRSPGAQVTTRSPP